MKRLWAYICFLFTGCSVFPKDAPAVSAVPAIHAIHTDKLLSAVQPAQPDQVSLLYTYAGISLFILGALTSAFWDKKSGLILILAGVFCGAVPFVIASSYFAWISAGTLLSLALCGLWWVKWKVRHEAEQEEQEDKLNAKKTNHDYAKKENQNS